MDPDEDNKQQRITLYDYKRELFLRLIPDI